VVESFSGICSNPGLGEGSIIGVLLMLGLMGDRMGWREVPRLQGSCSLYAPNPSPFSPLTDPQPTCFFLPSQRASKVLAGISHVCSDLFGS
jgi:hypothetical protein